MEAKCAYISTKHTHAYHNNIIIQNAPRIIIIYIYMVTTCPRYGRSSWQPAAYTIHYGGTPSLTLYFFIYRRSAGPGNRRQKLLPRAHTIFTYISGKITGMGLYAKILPPKIRVLTSVSCNMRFRVIMMVGDISAAVRSPSGNNNKNDITILYTLSKTRVQQTITVVNFRHTTV